MRTIYFDNASTTILKPPHVIEDVAEAMRDLGNASRGTYDASIRASEIVYCTRQRVSELFQVGAPERVVFTSNATEALNIAINGLFQSGDHIISTDLEHNSVLRPLYRLEAEQGVELSFVPADSQGNIDYADFERLIRQNTKGIVCTHGSNVTGNLLDIARIGYIAKQHGLLFIVDASQTAGCVPIYMQDWYIDVLCFTGHKGLMGPQGTGGLCIAEGVDIRPWNVGGTGFQSYLKSQPEEYPERLEAGTLNVPGLAGLYTSLSFIQSTDIFKISNQEKSLMWYFYDAASHIPNIIIYGDFTEYYRCPIVSLGIKGYDVGTLADDLYREYGIATRAGTHCAPRMHKALGTDGIGDKAGAVRFSFSFYNTHEEVQKAIHALETLAKI